MRLRELLGAGVMVVCACVATAVEAGTINVPAGGDLQAAIDSAKPGDTIVLAAGATFTGNFKLPAKGGTSYITIRSSTPDSQLPPAGTRISPAHASLLAKIRPSTAGGAALRTIGAASYWRLLFLEFLPSISNGGANLVEFGSAGSSQTTLSSVPHHLVMDRCYVHGSSTYGQRRGVALNSGDTQIINSHFSDIKGVNQDTQAIAGWNGPGPFLIENNHLAAAAENILFGGSDPHIVNLVPSDITIRRNLITKPLAWRNESWTVKNLLEFKNAQRVMVEGNVLENNWAAGQQGYAILFTPRNQSGTAPWSVVKDITVQHNIIRNVAGGFNISGYDNLATSQQTRGIVIRNNLVYGVSKTLGTTKNPAPGWFGIIGNGPRDITIDHNTVDNDGTTIVLFYAGSAPTGWKIQNFTLTNNLLRDNKYGVFGGVYGEGNAAFTAYTPVATVAGNTFAGADAKMYPPANDFPTIAQWLLDFIGEATGDYHLSATSLSNNAATDGKDIGVDWAALDAAMQSTGSTPPPPGDDPPPSPPPSGSTPYSGTAISLPGAVEAEHYDKGGEGIGYHDTTSGNTGNVFRSDNVDLQVADDTGGGYKVKTAVAGEWLNYSVNVTTAGTYTLNVRVTSGGAGGRFHIEVNGVDKTGPLTVPDTGGWQSWRTLSKTGVALSAGPQVMRLVLDSNGSGTGMTGNFNWMSAALTSSASASASTPYSGTPVSLPGTIEAEHYDLGGAGVAYHDTSSGNGGGMYRSDHVDLQVADDAGGGYKVKTAVAGEWLRYAVQVVTSGAYALGVRVASGGSGGRFHIEVDGVDVSGPMTVPDTGGWQRWTTLSKAGVALEAGVRVVRLVLDTNGGTGMTGNFNWIRMQ